MEGENYNPGWSLSPKVIATSKIGMRLTLPSHASGTPSCASNFSKPSVLHCFKWDQGMEFEGETLTQSANRQNLAAHSMHALSKFSLTSQPDGFFSRSPAIWWIPRTPMRWGLYEVSPKNGPHAWLRRGLKTMAHRK